MKPGSPVRKEFQFGGHRVVLETGKIARQATGAVMATMGDTVVLCTVVANPKPNPNQDFFPLTVTTRRSSTPPARSRVDSCAAKDDPATRRR